MIYGSLQTKKGYYYVVAKVDGKQKWISTGIPEKGNNKRRAIEQRKKILDELEAKEKLCLQENKQFECDSLFSDGIRIYLENKKNSVRITSWEAYESNAIKHILPYFDPLKLSLSEIRPQHIRDYFNFKRKQKLSANSIKKHLVLIRGTLQIAVEDGILGYNPAYRLNLPKNKKFKSSYYNEDQSKMLLSVIQDDPCESAIVLGLYYGLRRSECLGLRWRDIDFDNGTIQIRNTVVRQKTQVEKEQTKSESSARTLYIVPETREYLLRLKRKQTENRLLFEKGYRVSDSVCVWPDGRLLSPSYVSQHFARLLKKNELPHIRFHELRHSCGSLLLNRGMSIKHIQEYLGHEQASTTLDRYSHLTVESKRESANTVGKALRVV